MHIQFDPAKSPPPLFGPDQIPKKSGFVTCGQDKIYYQEYGNPEGIPILYVQGGPGSRINPNNSKCFDLNKYRVIMFDQRGAGISDPSLFPTAANPVPDSSQQREPNALVSQVQQVPPSHFSNLTVDDLVEDLETLRQNLNIDQWAVMGWSWGTTISMAYAKKHPDRLTGLILYGVYLNSKQEMDDYFKVSTLKQRFESMPEILERAEKALGILVQYLVDHHEKYNQNPPKTAEEILEGYYSLCVKNNDLKAQFLWEAYSDFINDPTDESLALLNLDDWPTQDAKSAMRHCMAVLSTILFRAPYQGFEVLDKNHTLARQLKEKNVPVWVVQGESDLQTPPDYAKVVVDELQQHNVNINFHSLAGGHEPPSHPNILPIIKEISNSLASHLEKK